MKALLLILLFASASFGQTVLGISHGGTGATTAAKARVNILPDTTGNTGLFLHVAAGGGIDWAAASGSGMSNPLTTTGDIIYSSSGSTPARLGIGSTADVLTVVSGVPAWKTKASYQATPADPTGTTSTTGVMMGLAGSITPTASGTALIIISGYGENTVGASDGGKIQISYGTGSAPANAAAITGTQVGGRVQFQYDGGIMNASLPFSVNAIITGLSVGTTYWVDLTLASLAGGTADIHKVSISVIEF